MGKLIVIEGTDGSGKATQTALLCERLASEGRAVRKLEFPRYDKDSSALVRLYLNGAFGADPDSVNAYAASTFFAVDRYASYREDWGAFYENGGLVVTDRYTTSNAVHQAAKLPDGERERYLDWLFDFEYRLLGIPAPDAVLYLDMPTAVTEQLMAARGNARDIHERDEAYLARCRRYALAAAERCGWHVIACARDGEPRAREDIAAEVYETAIRAVEG